MENENRKRDRTSEQTFQTTKKHQMSKIPDQSDEESESTRKELLNSTPIPQEDHILSESLTEEAKVKNKFSVPETPLCRIQPKGRNTNKSIPETPQTSDRNKTCNPTTGNKKTQRPTQDPTKDNNIIDDLFNENKNNKIDNE